VKYLTVDRFEGDFAVCEQESGKYVNIEKSRIDNSVVEGDIILIPDGGDIFVRDAVRTEAKRKAITDRFRKLL
jgi:hypothetical protein